jgi:hypothetical protein
MDDKAWTTDSEGYQHDDERCAWQHASGLIGGGGDPSDVTPSVLELYVIAQRHVAHSARRLLDAMDDLDAASTDYHENGAYGRVQTARRELREALADLPRDE